MAGLVKTKESRKGQTLIIALMVMFILALVASIFIAMIARNLFGSERASDVDAVTQIAEAGVRYADKMLTMSEDGADWRPIPDNLAQDLSQPPPNPVTGQQPTPVADWDVSYRDAHPDFVWTRPYWPEELPVGSDAGTGYAGPTGGFTTFNFGQGRFLLRVTYRPDINDPLSKYIKIESIGRWGNVVVDDPNTPGINEEDPTTWLSVGNPNLKREVTAYKPIGITDYLRFVTNKTKSPQKIPLGCPGLDLDFGRETSRFGYRASPIRINGDLEIHGGNMGQGIDVVLRGVYQTDMSTLRPIDMIEVAGEISFNDPASTVNVYRLQPDGSSIDGPLNLLQSDNTSYNTYGGFIRDSREASGDAFRRIKRIEPPLVDQPDLTSTSTRYRRLTLNSGERVQLPSGEWINLGEHGWGRGIYISNKTDRQDESETLFGGYNLKTDWLDPNGPISKYWQGSYYVPPAVVIQLMPYDVDNDPQSQPDIIITRTDIGRGGAPIWLDAWGEPKPEWGNTVIMPYPDTNNPRRIFKMTNGTFNSNEYKDLEGDGVIFAEGNIRVRGMLPPGMQLTIVSDENIYIDGSVLKYREPGGAIPANDPWRGADNSCGIALLARKNVVVNTTQFFSPQNTISSDDIGSDSRTGEGPYHVIVGPGPESRPRFLFEFAPWESETGTEPSWSDRGLFLRHAGDYGAAYINAWMNPGPSRPLYGALLLNTAPLGSSLFPTNVWGTGDLRFTGNPAGWGVGTAFIGNVFPLTGGEFTQSYGTPNIFEVGLEPNYYVRNNYLLSRFSVQPFDVRIEAICYAQDGSFFVIPGPWFNPSETEMPRFLGTAQYPYKGDAQDIRIIVDGAVSENIPASASDVVAWMEKWGRIPTTYGSSSTATAHPGEGFTILYDDHCAWPLLNPRSTTGSEPIRYDEFGRAYPLAPKLPVTGTLLYFGENK